MNETDEETKSYDDYDRLIKKIGELIEAAKTDENFSSSLQERYTNFTNLWHGVTKDRVNLYKKSNYANYLFEYLNQTTALIDLLINENESIL